MNSWIIWAMLSAIFAGLTALLAKLGMENVPSNLATLIRTIVIVIFASAIVALRGEWQSMPNLSTRNWTFLLLSGIATGLSWLFYFAALKNGPLSVIAPIDKLSFVIAVFLGVSVLGERVNTFTLLGCLLIVCGVLLTLPIVQAAVLKLF